VTGVILQGRWDRGLGQEWTTQVRLQTWAHGGWLEDGVTRPANVDTKTPVLISLNTSVNTDKVRVIPVSRYPRTVCIRLELCGCDADSPQETFEDVHDEVHDIKEELHFKVDSREGVDSSGRTFHYNSNFMSVVIGVLVTVILILTSIIIFILYTNNSNKSSLQQTTTTAVPKYDYGEYMSPPSSYYSNDSYTEYSRPLLGPVQPSSGSHKLLWDFTFPPPPPLSPQSSLKLNQQTQQYLQTSINGVSARGHHYASTSILRPGSGSRAVLDSGHPV